MYHKPRVPDHQIVQKVTTQLPRRGIRPPCNVRVSVRNGTVTLSGTIEFEMQRKAAVHAATGVNGVLRVIDNLTVMRNTIGGWHAKSPGMQLKHVRTTPHPPSPQEEGKPAPQESSESESTAASPSQVGPSPETATPAQPKQDAPTAVRKLPK